MDGAALVDLLERLCGVQPGPAYDGRRATSVLALAPEIAEAPDLLARYAATTGPADDRTLVLLAPVLDDAAIARIEAAIERAGLSDDTLPDVLLAPVPMDPVEQRALAREACGLPRRRRAAGVAGEPAAVRRRAARRCGVAEAARRRRATRAPRTTVTTSARIRATGRSASPNWSQRSPGNAGFRRPSRRL